MAKIMSDPFRQRIRDLERYVSFLEQEKSYSRKIDIIKELYHEIKLLSSEMFQCYGEINKSYKKCIKILEKCEKLLPKEQIISYSPHRFTEVGNVPKGGEELLNYLVNFTRTYLYTDVRESFYTGELSFEEMDLTSLCISASGCLKYVCEDENIPYKIILIEPGFASNSSLYGGGCKHLAVIINLEGREFLLDCTYSQFFWLKNCILEKIGIVLESNCFAGIFMTLDPERKKVAEKILKDGWIELKGDVLKYYLDGFACSYRNGLYYENTGDFSYQTPYSVEKYREFLEGKDSQLAHEGDVLGYQYVPLKDPNMKFPR